jgi:hypothetical protein
MRKLMILCLAVGLALASSEQWIGRSQNPHYTIPDPQPGIFPFTPSLFLDVADSLKYDDNMAASAWRGFSPGDGFGVKFMSPSDNVTLAGALVYYWSGWPTPGDTWAKIKVFADDGIGGAPGTQLFASDSFKITRGAWNYIPVNTPVVASNFYIFHEQVGSDSFVPGLAIDASNNSPSGRQWEMHGGGGFTEEFRQGDWLIRAVLDWTPQDTNASAVWFATNMPQDTVPNINFQIRATIRNMGSDPLAIGTPVRLSISGPESYVYNDTMATTTALNHGATAQMNFAPAWHIPNVAGVYNIKVWTEAAGEDWPADDTIAYNLSCAKWIQYHNEANMHWLTWASPLRAVKFNPADFSLSYPIGISRVRADFYLYLPTYPWPDSSFTFSIYGDDGSTLLYQSDTVEAVPGQPGPYSTAELDSMLIIPSGAFYVAVEPVSSTGHPSTAADSGLADHSYYGTPGAWALWTPGTGLHGNFYISAAVQGNVGIEEGFEPGLNSPSLKITNYPNPVTDQVTLKWQVPSSMPISVSLYDATGRMVRNLYTVNDRARVGTLTMDTRSLAAGIYLVRLETAKGSATRKLVVDR